MKHKLMTDVVQSAYERAKSDLISKILPIKDIEDLCHVAHVYALKDLYNESKTIDRKCHYDNIIDELYKLFEAGELSEGDSYATFAFCYLKVLEVEDVIKKKSFLAQFEHEKMKHT